MSKTHNKYSKSFTNGYDDTHHVAKKLKETITKKIEKHVDNALKTKDINKVLVLEERY